MTAAILTRKLRTEGAEPVDRKRVCRIMQAQTLLPVRRHSERSGRAHNGGVATVRSNLRRCSDGFGFTCRNGDILRGAFIIDDEPVVRHRFEPMAHDREIIARCAVVNAGIAGSDLRDTMLAAVEARPSGHRAPHRVGVPSDNGSPHIVRDTRILARQTLRSPAGRR